MILRLCKISFWAESMKNWWPSLKDVNQRTIQKRKPKMTPYKNHTVGALDRFFGWYFVLMDFIWFYSSIIEVTYEVHNRWPVWWTIQLDQKIPRPKKNIIGIDLTFLWGQFSLYSYNSYNGRIPIINLRIPRNSIPLIPMNSPFIFTRLPTNIDSAK